MGRKRPRELETAGCSILQTELEEPRLVLDTDVPCLKIPVVDQERTRQVSDLLWLEAAL